MESPAQRATRITRRTAIQFIKTHRGCELCGDKSLEACQLQFDHLDPATKSFTVGQSYLRSFDVLLEEVRKCRVLCANCHSLHTHR